MKPALVAGVVLALFSGIAGGLLRAGALGAFSAFIPWLAPVAIGHGALMTGCFFGTVIGIERAVAAKRRFAWIAPFASAAAGVAFVAGAPPIGAALLLLASAVFLANGVLLWLRERALHTFMLAAAGAAWLAGNVLLAGGMPGPAAMPWWFIFLVVTVAAERLEMMRMMRPRPLARVAFVVIVAALPVGAAMPSPLFGLALSALAGWLAAFDVARRTIRAAGLPRYMAVCLLAGYAWLALGGVAWILQWYDAAVHAVALGFIVSMVMAHAPVILPAVAGIRLRFSPLFYVPLAALHATLAWRLAQSLAAGAIGNAVAIALFGAVVIASARQQKGRPKAA